MAVTESIVFYEKACQFYYSFGSCHRNLILHIVITGFIPVIHTPVASILPSMMSTNLGAIHILVSVTGAVMPVTVMQQNHQRSSQCSQVWILVSSIGMTGWWWKRCFQRAGFWIPACAGMTGWAAGARGRAVRGLVTGSGDALRLAKPAPRGSLDNYGIARFHHCLVAACQIFQRAICPSALVFADLPIVPTV